MATLGERLKFFIKSEYGTLDNFGDVVGMSKSHLSAYQTGDRTPMAEQLRRFHEAGLNINWLLTGSGPMRAQTDEQAEKQDRLRRDALTQAKAAHIELGKFLDEIEGVI